MKKVQLGILFLLLILISACQSEDPNKENVFSFAASGQYRPFSFVDQKGELTGFDIDVGKAIAQKLNKEPKALKYKFSALIEGVKSGRFDAAVASHTITKERAQYVDFSTPYYYSGPKIFVRPDSKGSKMSIQDKEIAVSKGSTYAQIAEKHSDEIKIYSSDITALQALANGRHQAVITDFITGTKAIQSGLELKEGELLGRSEQAVAVSKKNPKLLKKINQALEEMRKDGTLKKLSMKYFGSDITSLE